MTEGGSGSGWGRACGITCSGCGLVLLIVVGITAALAPDAGQRVKALFERESLMEAWQGPPEGTAIEDLLPLEVDGLGRGSVTIGPGPEVLALDDEEWPHATYTDAERTIEVWVERADEEERDELFSWAGNAIRDLDGAMTSSIQVGNTQSFRFGRPARSASLRWADGWIFLFYAEGAGEMGRFGDELFRMTDRSAPDETASD